MIDPQQKKADTFFVHKRRIVSCDMIYSSELCLPIDFRVQYIVEARARFELTGIFSFNLHYRNWTLLSHFAIYVFRQQQQKKTMTLVQTPVLPPTDTNIAKMDENDKNFDSPPEDSSGSEYMQQQSIPVEKDRHKQHHSRHHHHRHHPSPRGESPTSGSDRRKGKGIPCKGMHYFTYPNSLVLLLLTHCQYYPRLSDVSRPVQPFPESA